ncbi:MAG: hypothetical protein QW166_04600 [Candidatus Bathyarchaeia archaeon]
MTYHLVLPLLPILPTTIILGELEAFACEAQRIFEHPAGRTQAHHVVLSDIIEVGGGMMYSTKLGFGATSFIFILIFATIIFIAIFNLPLDSVLVGIFTAVGAVFSVAWLATQTSILAWQTFVDVLVRLHNEFFFKGDNRRIIRAIERGTFALKPGKYLSEKLVPDNCEMQKIFWCEEEDLDDYLGVIELLCVLWKEKVLEVKYIEKFFGHYICKAWKDPCVRKYIEDVRNIESCRYYYSGFEELAGKLDLNNRRKKGPKERSLAFSRVFSRAFLSPEHSGAPDIE